MRCREAHGDRRSPRRLRRLRWLRRVWRARPWPRSLASLLSCGQGQDFTPRSAAKWLDRRQRDTPTPHHLPAYRLPSPYDRAPLRRRATSFALAAAINLALLLLLIGLGVVKAPLKPGSRTLTVDLMPQSRSSSAKLQEKTTAKPQTRAAARKPPPIVIPSKPTIATPSPSKMPWIEMSKAELAASDISKLPKAGDGGAGDS